MGAGGRRHARQPGASSLRQDSSRRRHEHVTLTAQAHSGPTSTSWRSTLPTAGTSSPNTASFASPPTMDTSCTSTEIVVLAARLCADDPMYERDGWPGRTLGIPRLVPDPDRVRDRGGRFGGDRGCACRGNAPAASRRDWHGLEVRCSWPHSGRGDGHDRMLRGQHKDVPRDPRAHELAGGTAAAAKSSQAAVWHRSTTRSSRTLLLRNAAKPRCGSTMITTARSRKRSRMAVGLA